MFARPLTAGVSTPAARLAVATLAGTGVRTGAGYVGEQARPPQADPSMRGEHNPPAPAPTTQSGRRPEEDRAMRRSLISSVLGAPLFVVTATRTDRLARTLAVNPNPCDSQSPGRTSGHGKPDAHGADPRWQTSLRSAGRAIHGRSK